MLDLFSSLKNLLKLEEVSTDNFLFRLHYKVTTIALFVFSIMVTSKQFFGDPIDCIVDDIPEKIIDNFCWISYTFSLANRSGIVGKDVLYPGVSFNRDSAKDIVHHKYYQWVCFTLFLQALMFYIPRYLWKNWEGGLLKTLAGNFKLPFVEENANRVQKKLLIKYFRIKNNDRLFYAFRFYFCELLNLVNVVGQIFMMDSFLGGEFTTYGLQVFSFSETNDLDRVDPMTKIFPKMAKCHFFKYGPSGSIQTYDALCILPLNVINEKVYIFLWAWFMVLTFLSAIGVLYRLFNLAFINIQASILWKKCSMLSRKDVGNLVEVLNVGDLHVLNSLGMNVNQLFFTDVVAGLMEILVLEKVNGEVRGGRESDVCPDIDLDGRSEIHAGFQQENPRFRQENPGFQQEDGSRFQPGNPLGFRPDNLSGVRPEISSEIVPEIHHSAFQPRRFQREIRPRFQRETRIRFNPHGDDEV